MSPALSFLVVVTTMDVNGIVRYTAALWSVCVITKNKSEIQMATQAEKVSNFSTVVL